MKKSLSAILISLLAFSYAADVSPTLSLRVNDMLGGLEFASPVIGLSVALGDGVNTGFDASSSTAGAVTTTNSRIYIERSYGRVGFGVYTVSDQSGDHEKPYFTIGATYNAYGNLNVDLDYVINQLATNTADALQLSLTIGF